ncbi:MAG TPA: transketolase C-terminal domain-containing protein [Vicinamibacterales bacterium]|nr:transketolase C-terminal domain-containing protein [Vicinamibacterales bacterium]
MRKAFIRTLADLAEDDERILLLTGDLGYTVIEPFADRFPRRFFNVGVAEQNLVGMATGLAESGYIPFVYSIATFAVMRAYEFIRNGPLAHGWPVRIVGIGGGFEYPSAGFTHYAVDDVGVMRVQPRMTIIAPADHQQAVSALRATWRHDGPIYYRLGKDDVNIVPGLNGRFEAGRAQMLSEGRDLLLLAMGPIARQADEAARQLSARGHSVGLMIVDTLNPPPVEQLRHALASVPVAMTVEAHYLVGGLGSLVSEIVAEHALGCRVARCGVADMPVGRTGSDAWTAAQHGLSTEGLVASALRALS